MTIINNDGNIAIPIPLRSDEQRMIDEKKKERVIATPEERAYLVKYYEEHIETLTECQHYAKQDLAQFYEKLDITHADKRKEAERVVREQDEEIITCKIKLSKLRAGEEI
jgi:hypothetical protein